MARLPRMSGRRVAKVFQHLGWRIARHENHIIMIQDGRTETLSIPDHKEVALGTLRSLIRTAGLTVAEFENAAQDSKA